MRDHTEPISQDKEDTSKRATNLRPLFRRELIVSVQLFDIRLLICGKRAQLSFIVTQGVIA